MAEKNKARRLDSCTLKPDRGKRTWLALGSGTAACFGVTMHLDPPDKHRCFSGSFLSTSQTKVTREASTSNEELPSLDLPWAYLWDIFLIAGWCERAQIVVGSAYLGQVVLGCIRKIADQASHGEQVSKQRSFVVSASVPALTSLNDCSRINKNPEREIGV